MAREGQGSETVDALVGLVVERGIAPRGAVERLRTKDRRAASLARRLCEERLLKPEVAWELLAEVRRRRRGKSPRPAIPESAPRMGPYRLLGELGRGGMGVVHRAWDERLRREVALKTIPGVADPAVRERLLREARAAGKLRHPGIVAVFAAEQIEGVCVLALELVRGTSLEKKITAQGPLPPERAAALVRDVALAVAHAHDNGVIHRDLKPANVLLDAQEAPHLTDFGVARDMSASAMTQTGVAVGTPAYMSPEQALGEPDKIGPATDVYGLGAVLYEALSGRAPFEGQNGIAILRQVVEDEPEPPSAVRQERGLASVPRDLETVCLKALEKAPERRYERAQEVAADLERFLKGEPVLARPIAWPERALRKIRRRPLLFSVVVIVVLVQLVLLAAARAQARHEARARRADFEARLA
ncbi:MAG TPA: serine/threonine-protein kinase, partial [Planctomycetota bacterium]|nr:serine/threonine-protein kinase [Planctomycetota bacterium]